VSVRINSLGRRGRLIRLEWRLLVTARTPWLVACLFLLTSAAALINGYDVVGRRQAAARDAVDAQSEQHEALRRDIARVEAERATAGIAPTRLQPGLPSVAAVEARVGTFRAALPPLPTAIVSAGRAQLLPQRYEVRVGGGARFWPFSRTVGTNILSGLLPEQPMDNPAAVVLGAFDLSFVTVYLYPLLILALMYDVVSGDRETGVLALVSAQPAAFGDWLATRVAVRGTVILAFGVLLPVAATAFTMTDWSANALTRLAPWSASVLAYGTIWLAFAVAVSLHTRASALSAIVSVSGWFVAVIVVPAALGLAAPFLAPATTRLSYTTEERAASLYINARVDAAVAALNQLVRTRFAGGAGTVGDHPLFTEPIHPPVEGELLTMFPPSPWTVPMPVAQLSRGLGDVRRKYVEQRLAAILRELDANERREAAFFGVAQFLSPALLLQAISDDVAGVGRIRWEQFLGQLDEYVREREAFFTTKVLGNENVTSPDVGGSLVPFGYREESISAVTARVGLPIGALISIAGALVLLCARSAVRWRG
jgi:ABC-2 type transport system permease protein